MENTYVRFVTVILLSAFLTFSGFGIRSLSAESSDKAADEEIIITRVDNEVVERGMYGRSCPPSYFHSVVLGSSAMLGMLVLIRFRRDNEEEELVLSSRV